MYCPYRSYFFSCPFFRNQHADPQFNMYMRIPPQSNAVTITTKEVKDQKPYIQANLKIPVLHGITNTNIQATINNSIQSDVMEFKRQMDAAAQEYGDKAAQSKEKFIPYIITSAYELTYNKNNIVSILMTYFEYVGGLNNYIKVPYNYDITTGKSLMLKDIFVPGVDYKSLINKEIRNELINNKQKYYPETADNFKGVAEDHPFYLKNGNLAVFFGFNEIAPTQAKIPIFNIPIGKFGDAIKPKFK